MMMLLLLMMMSASNLGRNRERLQVTHPSEALDQRKVQLDSSTYSGEVR